ncbi:cyclin-D5-1-like [Typha latifolia]|uniref:cyclin-D5-1-like n=1 Tax=Typha latifolia TaxID=4733 RepID=UPI003C2B4EF2
MEDDSSDCSGISISHLICQEDCTDLDSNGGNEEARKFIPVGTEDEYIEKLVSKELAFESQGYHRSSPCDEWFIWARSTAVRWILQMRICYSFNHQTAYVAVSYFDRFFARRAIDKGKTWAVRLLSIACLSLAAKMEESKVPLLSDFSVEEYEFDIKAIQRMELLVLTTLEWRMSSVTPFEYLNYFPSKFECNERSKDSMHRAMEFIFDTIEVMNTLNYRPSTMAAAAILAASNERLTKELVESKMSTLTLCGSLDKENVYACYYAMYQESYKKLKILRRLASSELSANCSSVTDAVDVTDTASFTTTGNKRRKLQ